MVAVMENNECAKYKLIEPMNKFHPPLLGDFSFGCTDNKLFLFGGYDYPSHSQTNLLYCFSLINGWKELLCNNAGPCPRSKCSMCCIGSKIFIFGGYSEVIGWMKDFYVLDLSTARWKLLSGIPSTSGNCNLVEGEEGCLYLSSGLASSSSNETQNDIWKYDIEIDSWNLLISEFNSNTSLAGYSMTKLGNRLIIIGGMTNDMRKNNLVCCFNIESQSWSNLVVGGHPPSARQFHSVSNAFDRYLIIFGGEDNDNWELDDLWLLDIEKSLWLIPCINDFAEAPCPRFGHASCILTDNHDHHQLIIFGGLSEVDPGSNIPQSVLNDMYSINLNELLSHCIASTEDHQNTKDQQLIKLPSCDDCFDC